MFYLMSHYTIDHSFNLSRKWTELICSRFKNVVFDIIAGPERGSFNVKARFLGVEMEEFLLKYQVKPRLHTELNTVLSPKNTNLWCVCVSLCVCVCVCSCVCVCVCVSVIRTCCSCSTRAWQWWRCSTRRRSTSTCSYSSLTKSFSRNEWSDALTVHSYLCFCSSLFYLFWF